MTRKTLILLATLGSAALLLGAFGFQHLGGLAPCKLCLWQRWPHAAAILIGVALLAGGHRLLAWLGALAAATTAGIGAYHAGVEWGWWPGPSSCTGGGMDLGTMTGGDLLSMDGPMGVVMCDEVVWQLAGLSMAGWNAVISLGLTAIWIAAARRSA
ncbi:disulfide bond formation protein B [Sulfitobacter sp. PR48]|uniref:Disulfide bond formation protein B n=1 Tax=Sulfitobacter porphyrae TaxID=1246864 RepID=A0ABW2B2K3_9RHOB|nr:MULTISPECIES: disulfide bond formation protein B [unclassified Sulfitobacter]MCZ4258494.1 disulfide bond formation protein B [Sulfitobacter sp. G21635-S1]MDD9723169.1 disulfide bond formation protein B [Sulfitobacter sp. PR48]GLT09827.1 dihydroneopterin aldolase [Sulfitobacter porphyrae]